jgi:hypothetical protein
MTHWNEADVEAMLAATGGVDVVHAAETGKGLVDEIDAETAQGLDTGVLNSHILVTVRTNAFPTLKVGDAITVEAVAHVVTDRRKIEDGALSKLLVRKS